MKIVAESKNIKISPRKVRIVVDSVRSLKLPQALSYLTLMEKRGAQPLKKTLESAIANAINNFKLKKEDLLIKEILVGEGIKYKRYHFAGRGRMRPYKKRTTNLKVVLSDEKGQNQNLKESVQRSKSKNQNLDQK